MSEYAYRATILIPVYNAEKYIGKCIESLTEQTVGFENIEILFVNDGSTDSSEEICRSFSERYENVSLLSKQNGGCASARNYGLPKAQGKYIFYLDADDCLKNDTVEAVTDFFDSVYDEVDLVTYRIIQYYNSEPIIVHYRYRTLTESGVYDLWDTDNRFITQTNVNICVKNRGENNRLFDTTENFRHEDEKYCCDILREKMKIGFCARGEYIYNRDNPDGIVSSQFSPETTFDTSMSFYEELFDSFGDVVPAYFQGIVFNDFRWKYKDGRFLPTHLDGEEWLRADRRIDRLLSRIEEDTIVLHPSVPQYYRFYWLMRRPNSHPIVLSDKKLSIISSGKLLYETDSIKAETDADGKTRLMSPVFFYLNKSQIKILCGGREVDFTLSRDRKNTDPLDFMPCFSIPGGEETVLKVIINTKEYSVKYELRQYRTN